MRILFVGDIVGSGGRKVLRRYLPGLQQEHEIDFTIANVENAAGGFGITVDIAEDILGYGVDVMTSGNHIWDKREVMPYFSKEPRLLRPGNYPPGLPGKDSFVTGTPMGAMVAVLNLQGRVFMPIIDCPFRRAEAQVERLSRQAKVIIVDFHAEATSEKMAFSWFLDGKVSAVIGTHTHVPTADERILPQGTAYISDVGMTGSYNSVIGMKVEGSLSRFLTGIPSRFESAKESPVLAAVVVDIDEESGKARSIHRVRAGGETLSVPGQ